MSCVSYSYPRRIVNIGQICLDYNHGLSFCLRMRKRGCIREKHDGDVKKKVKTRCSLFDHTWEKGAWIIHTHCNLDHSVLRSVVLLTESTYNIPRFYSYTSKVDIDRTR